MIKKRLECPEQIEEEIAGLRKDFLLNEKCNMLVLVSMATDEMIQCIRRSGLWTQLLVSAYEFIFNMNS